MTTGNTTAGPRIAFVVPVRNDAQRLQRCLTSIARASRGHDTELMVVDNGSRDDSRQVATALGARVLQVAEGPVSRLRNEGAAQTSGELLAFVDADHEIADSWVSAALARFADPGIAAVGAQYHPPAHSTWVQRTYDAFRRHAPSVAETDWLGSGNLIVRRQAFAAVSGFNPRLHACEDVDFCARLRNAGFRLVEDPALYTEHLGDPETLGLLFRSELWRGRNNLAVTLASGRSLRSVISLAIPVVNLTAICAAAFGMVLMDWRIALAALLTLLILAMVRAALMLRTGPVTLLRAAQCTIVAAVYHAARGLALVWPAKHRRDRIRVAVAIKGAL